MTNLIRPARWFKSLLARASGNGEFVVDMFAGGGGTSKGIEAALGSAVDIAINHDEHAIAIHRANHPKTYHFLTDVREVNPRKVLPQRQVGLLWLSPDCTHHSRAKGGKPVKRNRRALANVGIVWAQARRPRVIILENVQEFEDWGPLGTDGLPERSKAGQSFKRWVGKLRRLGYQVEWRALVAADYGAPTIRKRLFLIARRDGRPIVWPSPTHAPADRAQLLGLQPWRAAYECIDWSLPCNSIFERKKPLADATLKRIHAGVFKFVFNGDPFIVQTGHQEGIERRIRSVDLPMRTLTASRDQEALVTGSLLSIGYGEKPGQDPRMADIKKPLTTLVGSRKHALVTAFLAGAGGPTYSGKPKHLAQPVGTLTTENHRAVAAAFLTHHRKTSDAKEVRDPMATLTTKAHDSLTTAHLTTFRGSAKAGRDMRDPMPGLTAGGFHIGEVRAFLVKYFKTGGPVSLRKPAPTLSTKHRLGLVEVHGEVYQLTDLKLRMLTPRELLRAQFGKYAEGYILLGNQAQQVKAIGNSVAPEVAEALVRANYMADQMSQEVAA